MVWRSLVVVVLALNLMSSWASMMPQSDMMAYGNAQMQAPRPFVQNKALLSKANTSVPSGANQFLEKHGRQVPGCSTYKKIEGSCDPELSLEPCVSCMTSARWSRDVVCPNATSFPPSLRQSYEWRLAKTTDAAYKMKRYLCIVVQLDPNNAPPPQQYIPNQFNDQSSMSQTNMIIGGGVLVGIFVILGFCGVACYMAS